jgi:POT family proton-dependent oligopeptide transporter
MALAAKFAANGMVSPLWLVAGYFIMTVAELCLSPIGLSLVSKLAPKQFLSLTMGCWFLTSFFGNMAAGFWGEMYDKMSPVYLFGGLAVFSFVAGGLLTVINKKLTL